MEQSEKLGYILKIYEKAYSTFESSCEKVDNWNEDIEILNDSIIQRFEYTFELSWKVLKAFLDYEGIMKEFPREIFKEAHKKGLIDNLDVFFDFLDIRNKLSHIYSEYSSKEAIDYILENYKVFERLSTVLKNR